MAPSTQPKSSFKGLRIYTENRDHPFKDMFQWLEGVQAHELRVCPCMTQLRYLETRKRLNAAPKRANAEVQIFNFAIVSASSHGIVVNSLAHCLYQTLIKFNASLDRLCQVNSTQDKADDFSENMFVNLTTFGDHPMHHLFPALCHSKLRFIKPIVIETLREFGVDYNGEQISQRELLAGLNRQCARTEPNNKLSSKEGAKKK